MGSSYFRPGTAGADAGSADVSSSALQALIRAAATIFRAARSVRTGRPRSQHFAKFAQRRLYISARNVIVRDHSDRRTET
jgi:hypothetical protein